VSGACSSSLPVSGKKDEEGKKSSWKMARIAAEAASGSSG